MIDKWEGNDKNQNNMLEGEQQEMAGKWERNNKN